MIMITPKELREKINNKEDIFILDVREPWEYGANNIHGSVNVPIGRLGEYISGIPKNKLIIIVCEHENRSEVARRALAQSGYNVLSLKGGMEAWLGG